jgi:hypothetical protein
VLAAPSVSLAHPLPPAVAGGATVVVSGRVHDSPHGAVIVLEQNSGAGWRVIVRGRVEKATFVVLWRPSSAGLVRVRAALRLHGRDVAASRAGRVLVGQKPVYCSAPVPPAQLPAGDGWVGGGLYDDGGPYPPIHRCAGSSYTVTVTDEAGTTVATQPVAAGQSYAIVLPAGSYTFASGFCKGKATVAAGRETKADTTCFVP